MKKLLLASAVAALSVTAANAEIRVGVLHSTTGTMAISETTLRDVMLMLIAHCLLYTSPSPRDGTRSRMTSSVGKKKLTNMNSKF